MSRKLNRVFLATAVVVSAWCASSRADVLNMGGTQNADGSWDGLASLKMVTVGNPGNAADMRYNLHLRPEGYGAVDYVYQIGKFEVTNAQWREFLTAKATLGDPYGLYSSGMAGMYGGIARSGVGTVANPYVYTARNNDSDWDNRPVSWVSFWDVARFCNWLHNGQGDGDTEGGAYINIGSQDTFARQPGAKWWIPSEDEWYKAAYHKNNGVTGDYWDFPTGTNAIPSNQLINPDPGNNENFEGREYTIGRPYYTTSVGEFENSDSAYVTFDQGGNLREWTEAADFIFRCVRGGSWNTDWPQTHASTLSLRGAPTYEGNTVGVRVASISDIPEPGSITLLLCGIVAALMCRGRGK